MNKTHRDAIYDAVAYKTGLTGVWAEKKGAPRMTGDHFMLKLLYPGTTIDRKGNVYYTGPEVNGVIQGMVQTRLMSTLQVTVFGDNTNMLRADNSHKFHSYLNAGEVVCNGLINSYDVSSVWTEYETATAYDFTITWCELDRDNDLVDTDEFIETVELTQQVEDFTQLDIIPNRSLAFDMAHQGDQSMDIKLICTYIDLIDTLTITDGTDTEEIGTDLDPSEVYPYTTELIGNCTLAATAHGYTFTHTMNIGVGD